MVASLGTAITEEQASLLKRYCNQVIIAFDSDRAGQEATIRAIEILQKQGLNTRVIQIEGAKDPDEYVIKYGSEQFSLLVKNAISLVEFKVKMLKEKYNIENTTDKVQFLMEVAKLLAELENEIEKEIYVDKISKEYGISKEGILSIVNSCLK